MGFTRDKAREAIRAKAPGTALGVALAKLPQLSDEAMRNAEVQDTDGLDAIWGTLSVLLEIGASTPPGPGFYRQAFIQLLKAKRVNQPNTTVLDNIERCYPARLIACSSATMALDLYNDVKNKPGTSTEGHFFTQHKIRVDGPLFPNSWEGPACLLKALTADGRPSVVKLLSHVGLNSEEMPGGPEASACKALYKDKPKSVPLAECEVLVLELGPMHSGTGHGPGRYAALHMPQYSSSLASLQQLEPDAILTGAMRMEEALHWVHNKGYVHMDVKADNIFVDQKGRWWLGDFGSAVPQGGQITSTTNWFTPKQLLGLSAEPKYDWYMLAVAVVCELHKNKWSEFKDTLIQDGHTPHHTLIAAIGEVQHNGLATWLRGVMQRATQ